MTFEMRAILESKRALRARMLALPVEETLRLLERLRERTLVIAASRSAGKRAQAAGPS